MLRRKRPSCRYSVRRIPREARDAREEEAVRDRLRQEQTADQAQIATERKDLYPLRSEGATITVRQKTGMAIVRQEISVTGTARVAMAETETVRDASVTARAEEEETEEITDHPFRPRLWQNRSRKGDPRRIIIRKKSMTVTRSGKANLVRSKARERKISSL